MTYRIYLAAARFSDDPVERSDVPAERIFVNASDVPEVWVETESSSVPEAGRVVVFALRRPLDLGFERVTGTVERRVEKGAAGA
jgi:hypothetical protein